ncbi:MAG: hypothetical protein LBV68_07575 [Spirochaetaceae bacterium]|jgi:HEPN domain-containing protein|nr:hypothetical protein [Spirochaetaceae bacterium]
MKQTVFFFLTFFLCVGLWAQTDDTSFPSSDGDSPSSADSSAVSGSTDISATPEEAPEADSAERAIPAQTPSEEPKASYAVLHNEFYETSLKERNAAKLALEAGNYDEALLHSSEAERNALLSNTYVEKKLLLARINKEIAEAAKRLSWAKNADAEKYYPDELSAAEGHYNAATDARDNEDWDTAIENARAVLDDLAAVIAPPKKDAPPPDMPPNPNKYVVRAWDKFGDCFWNIAKWFYNDPWKWPILYKANKDKLPNPNNPDLITVDTIIDIPNLGNENRVGMYDTGSSYMR